MRARGGRAGRRCSRGRGVRQDALRDPVSPTPSHLSQTCKCASLGLGVCSKLAPFVCVCAGAGRSRGRCGGWPAAGGDPAPPRRTRGPATRRRQHRLAAPGLVLASLTIKASLSLFALLPSFSTSAICATWVHRSRIVFCCAQKHWQESAVLSCASGRVVR